MGLRMNPNHTTPHYLGSTGPNLNLLDNMLMAAGFQVNSPLTGDQHKGLPSQIPLGNRSTQAHLGATVHHLLARRSSGNEHASSHELGSGEFEWDRVMGERKIALKNWHKIMASLTPCVQPQIPTVTSSDPVHVIVYQNDGQQQQQQQQQQPISYKIPQLGVVSQEQVKFPHH